MNTIERRAAVELRAASGKRLVGYGAVFDRPSRDLGGFTEIVRPGAFKRTLESNALDPLALVQHLPHIVLGRRSAGTLRLHEDGKGLAFEIDVPDTTAARDLLVSVERGDVSGASFAFVVPAGGDHWDVRGDTMIRELRDVSLHEITITASPAYADTSVALRTLRRLSDNHPFRLGRVRRFLETTL
jgi:HK97 family phage prohead protease